MAIYLDSAASTRVKPEVLDDFMDVATHLYANPSSEHTEGYLADNCIEFSKGKISAQIHCDNDDVFFTTGATMSNQLLIQGFVAKNPHGMVITTNVEHNDIILLMEDLTCHKYILKVGEDGLINLTQLAEILRYSSTEMNIPTLVTIQMANSETGIVQPIREISNIVRKYDNAFLHMDATQYIPHYPINIHCWGIDSISMSGQKIGGLKGSGLLVVRQTLRESIKPIIFGEQGLIGGTPATPLISSLGTAFSLLNYNISDPSYVRIKRDELLSSLQDLGAILVGGLENRLPNNIYCRFPGVDGLTLLHVLDERGIYIGTGSACSTDSDKPSHVAKAYGLTDEEAFECVRFTLSNETSFKDIEKVVKTLQSVLPLITKS